MTNEEFYTKVQIPKKDQYSPVIFSTYWLFYILGNVLVIFLVPLISKYKRAIVSFHEYLRLCGISAAIILVLNIIFTWFMDIRPYLDKRKGFYWRGNFTVVAKELSLGSNYLTLKPGNHHRIKVRSEFYRSVQERDRILLERTYLGDITKIRKISSGFPERVKRRGELHEVD